MYQKFKISFVRFVKMYFLSEIWTFNKVWIGPHIIMLNDFPINGRFFLRAIPRRPTAEVVSGLLYRRPFLKESCDTWFSATPRNFLFLFSVTSSFCYLPWGVWCRRPSRRPLPRLTLLATSIKETTWQQDTKSWKETIHCKSENQHNIKFCAKM